MTRRSLITLSVVLIAMAVALSGCTTFDNFKEGFLGDTGEAEGSINIGVFEPMVGADKEAAQPEIRGIELAHKYYPRSGDRKVNLIYADNNSNINAAETAISTLVSKKPSVILGSYGNIYSLVAGEYINDAKIPAITMTNTNPLVTRNNSYYFRICYIDSTQGRLLANYLDSLDVENVGVLLPREDDAAMAMATAFTNAFEEITGQNDATGFYEEYTMGELDFSEHLKTLRKSGVEYVLLPGDNKDSHNIINQAAKMGLNVTFLGDMSWGEEAFHKGLGKQVDPRHIAFVQFFATDGDDHGDIVSESRQQFLDAYHREYGENQDPEEAVALGYDAYMLAMDAIDKTTSTRNQVPDGTAIRDLLLSEEYQFEGASGSIQFNKYGDPKKTAYISTWDGDAVKALYTIETNQQ